VRWKADTQSLMIKKIRTTKKSWRKFILKKYSEKSKNHFVNFENFTKGFFGKSQIIFQNKFSPRFRLFGFVLSSSYGYQRSNAPS
jgi:hypothetical protein